jgi:hypothetical protein
MENILEDILVMRLTHDIDRDIITQLWRQSGVDESEIKENLSFMDMKFEDKLYRIEHSLTNEDIHRY